MLKRLKLENFDFAITELMNFCGFALFHKLGIDKYASVSITDMMEVIIDPLGVSSNPSFVPGFVNSLLIWKNDKLEVYSMIRDDKSKKW